MKISAVKKLIPEEFSSEERGLVKKIANILNPFIEQASKILNGGFLLKDNSNCRVFSIELESGQTTVKPSWKSFVKPTAVFVCQIMKEGSIHISSAYSFSWKYNFDSENNPILDISFVGLSAAKHYITLIAIG